MRLYFHDLIGRQVLTADGRSLGRIANLRAEPRDGKLRVTSLLVGPGALLERIASRVPFTEVSWSLVRRVGERVELRATAADLSATIKEHDGEEADG